MKEEKETELVEDVEKSELKGTQAIGRGEGKEGIKGSGKGRAGRIFTEGEK